MNAHDRPDNGKWVDVESRYLSLDESAPPSALLCFLFLGVGCEAEEVLGAAAFQASAFARGAFGDVIVDHYATFFDNEVLAFERAVTDFEMRRYFEQI